MFKSRGPTFDQLPKRVYEIDYHVNHTNLASAIDLQRSKYIQVDDDVLGFGSANENTIELNLKFCKSYVVEKKNRKILAFKSQFV